MKKTFNNRPLGLLNGINDKLVHKKKLQALEIQLIFANMSIIIIKHNQMEVNATLECGINHLLVQKIFMDNDGNYVYILGWIPYLLCIWKPSCGINQLM